LTVTNALHEQRDGDDERSGTLALRGDGSPSGMRLGTALLRSLKRFLGNKESEPMLRRLSKPSPHCRLSPAHSDMAARPV
jgi:hypothetical protein